MTNRRTRSVVLGMSLAEVFLVALFVVLWSWRTEEQNRRDTQKHLETSEQQLNDTRAELQQLQSEHAATVKERDALRLIAARANPKGLTPMGRGKPACQPRNNTLAEVRVIRGRETLIIVEDIDSPIVLSDRRNLVRGMEFDSSTSIDMAVAAIWEYSLQMDCRFDHRRVYCEDSDYLRADRFQERLFPAGPMRRTCDAQ